MLAVYRRLRPLLAAALLFPAGLALSGLLFEAAPTFAGQGGPHLMIAGAVTLLLGVGLIALHIQRTNRRLKQVLERQSLVEAQLRESESRHRTLFQISPSAAIVWGPGCVVSDWNRQAEVMFGWRREEVIGRCFLDFMIPAQEKAELGAQLLHLTDENVLPHSINRNRTKDGRIIICEWFNAWLPREPGGLQEVISLANDITQRKHLEDEVRQLAFYDTLTGLPNRRLLHDRIIQARAASRRHLHYCALMLLDLDNFKPLNDTHGHEVGDLLLIEVARRMKQCVRETDTVVRFGGDEFVVLIGALAAEPWASEEQAMQVAEKIREALAAPYHLHTATPEGEERIIEHRCSVSIGVTIFRDNHASESDLLKWADIAMYRAKEGGRNRVVLHQSTGDGAPGAPLQHALPLGHQTDKDG